MKKYSVLLVDDEYLALNLLEEYARRIPELEVVAKCKSAQQAITVLEQEQIDILFSDIQMPSMSGVDMLRSLVAPPPTIFTTAYRGYAAEAFELAAIDYLVKPFSYERFVQAVNRAQRAVQPNHQAEAINRPAPTKPYFVAKVDGRLVRIPFAEICYIEGLKEYVRIVCEKEKFVVFERMKNMESYLPKDAFMRVHKSYIIACKHVKSLEGHLLDIGIQKIPISRSKKEEITARLF